MRDKTFKGSYIQAHQIDRITAQNKKFKQALPNESISALEITTKIKSDMVKNHLNYYLLVEGEQDKEILSKVINAKVTIYAGKHSYSENNSKLSKKNKEVTGGKNWVKKILRDISKIQKEPPKFVFAIIDEDFNRVLNIRKDRNENIFYIRPNSLWTMLWSVDRISHELSKATKLKRGTSKSIEDWHDHLVTTCKTISMQIGLLRIVNEIESCGINFQILKQKELKRFISNDGIFDTDAFLKFQKIEIPEKFRETYEAFSKNLPDINSSKIFNYLNDHDVVSVISLLADRTYYPSYRKTLEGDKNKESWFSKVLKPEDFQKTSLYKSISQSAYAACLKN